MDFNECNKENSTIFLYKMISEFNRINYNIYQNTGKMLELPKFSMIKGTSRWGYWDANERKISLSIELFKNFEWGAAVHVLKHEMAHMVVSEIFKFENCRAHGEAFKLACKSVGVDDRRCCSEDFLRGFKGSGESDPIVSKIRKLMSKGQCSSVTDAEANIFLNKARELMHSYNLTQEQITGSEKTYVQRPVGGKHKRFPTWLWDLGNLVSDYYYVKYIRSCERDRNFNSYYYIELFGDPSNVDVAEYVFHVLMYQGLKAYEEHKNNPNRNHSYRKLSKVAFMKGVIRGYRSKLGAVNKETVTEEEYGIIKKNDAVLKEEYEKSYPNMKNVSVARAVGDGAESGFNAGKNITINDGVKSSSSTILIG